VAVLSLQAQQVITYLDISEDETTGHAIHQCATHFVFTVTLRTHNTISHKRTGAWKKKLLKTLIKIHIVKEGKQFNKDY